MTKTTTYAEDEEPPDTDPADDEKKNSAENAEDIEEEFTNRLNNTRRPSTIDRSIETHREIHDVFARPREPFPSSKETEQKAQTCQSSQSNPRIARLTFNIHR